MNKVKEGKGAFGWNGAGITNVYEDLIEAGVIDPTKVVRTALTNAASVAALACSPPRRSLLSVRRRRLRLRIAHGGGGGMGDGWYGRYGRHGHVILALLGSGESASRAAHL